MRVTFLGTGTSRGIPVIGCDCATCRSEDPRNKRLRSSILVEGSASVVIDTSVDFRLQMLRAGVRQLDAVVFTHHHADHVLGLDDVYPFNIWSGKAIDAFADLETGRELRATFRYLFGSNRHGGIPQIQLHEIDGPFQVGDLNFTPIPVFHGKLPILGYRIGQFAYLTDVSRIPESSQKKLKGVTTLVIDGLRFKRHPTHFTIPEAIEAASKIGALKTYLIHMSHDVNHAEVNNSLPPGIELAYDELVLEIES